MRSVINAYLTDDGSLPYVSNAKENVSYYGMKGCIGVTRRALSDTQHIYMDVGYNNIGTSDTSFCWPCHVTVKSMPGRIFCGKDMWVPIWRC